MEKGSVVWRARSASHWKCKGSGLTCIQEEDVRSRLPDLRVQLLEDILI